MSPKVKITKENIVNTALELVGTSGAESLNARAIAAALSCSTQPVFFNFSSMEDLHEAVHNAAYERYLGFLKKESESGKYPTYKAFGMAYVRFAKEEKELFKLLFMGDRREKGISSSPDFEASIRMITDALGITKEKAELMHFEMWTCVHGIASMLATSFLSLDTELISNMLTDVYQGLRARHLSEVK